jgi:hypothetical protein
MNSPLYQGDHDHHDQDGDHLPSAVVAIDPLHHTRQRIHNNPSVDVVDALQWDDLLVDDTAPLLALADADRVCCDSCGASFKVFCPDCSLPLSHAPKTIRLPLPLDVYRHPNERKGKTTSVHAKVCYPFAQGSRHY